MSTAKTVRTTNMNARPLVKDKVPFQGSNLYSERFALLHGGSAYVVYSYGEHWPLFICVTSPSGETTWYENSDRYSITTSIHRTRTHPHCDTVERGCAEMRKLADDLWHSRRKAA